MEGFYPLFGALVIVGLILDANWYVLLRPERPPRNHRLQLKREKQS